MSRKSAPVSADQRHSPLSVSSQPTMSTRLHSDPPFRVEHVGSLLRPKYLLEKRAQLQAQQCTPEELKAAEDAAIVEVVKFQQENGLKTITDGEYRR